jgi:hypothetical protein
LLSMDAIADETLTELPYSSVAGKARSTQLLHDLMALVRNALIAHCGALHERFPVGMIAH